MELSHHRCSGHRFFVSAELATTVLALFQGHREPPACERGHRALWMQGPPQTGPTTEETISPPPLSVRRSKKRLAEKFYTGELNSYLSMLSRCYRKNKNGEHSFEAWGGRGIRVCDRWLEAKGKGFQNFLDDLGPRPSLTSLDRVNPQASTPRSTADGVHQKNRRGTRLASCGRTKHHRPFPLFEIRTSKSTPCLEMSCHTDTRCHYTDTKAPGYQKPGTNKAHLHNSWIATATWRIPLWLASGSVCLNLRPSMWTRIPDKPSVL
jgi:hypothetical protein